MISGFDHIGEACHNPYFNRWFSAIYLLDKFEEAFIEVTILILIDGFLQSQEELQAENHIKVTILILIDGFLQSLFIDIFNYRLACHNPYFNRWFSAIVKTVTQKKLQIQSQSLF